VTRAHVDQSRNDQPPNDRVAAVDEDEFVEVRDDVRVGERQASRDVFVVVSEHRGEGPSKLVHVLLDEVSWQPWDEIEIQLFLVRKPRKVLVKAFSEPRGPDPPVRSSLLD
jgi:hypothetical protein